MSCKPITIINLAKKFRITFDFAVTVLIFSLSIFTLKRSIFLGFNLVNTGCAFFIDMLYSVFYLLMGYSVNECQTILRLQWCAYDVNGVGIVYFFCVVFGNDDVCLFYYYLALCLNYGGFIAKFHRIYYDRLWLYFFFINVNS